MKHIRIILLFTTLASVVTVMGQSTTSAPAPPTQASPEPPSLTSVVDREITAAEKQIFEVAERLSKRTGHAKNPDGGQGAG